MDGTGRIVIDTFNSTIVVDLALDYATQTLYWVNGNNIESSSADRTNSRVLVSNTYSVQSLDFFGGSLYLTNYRTVISVSVRMPNTSQTVYSQISSCGNILDTKVVSEERQSGTPIITMCMHAYYTKFS